MSKKGDHPWPTDGVTRRQMDRQVDRLEKRIHYLKEDLRELKAAVAVLKGWHGRAMAQSGSLEEEQG